MAEEKQPVVPFWHEYEAHGYLSQWYPSQFKLTIGSLPEAVLELQFCRDHPHKLGMLEEFGVFMCAEQFMMAAKAILFDDVVTLRLIRGTASPKRIKALGRKVHKFDQTEWDLHCRDIVKIATILKFTQDPALQAQLLATGDSLIAEASPGDHIWGIGLHPNDVRVQDPRRWRGTNYLGDALMWAREAIRQRRLAAPAAPAEAE
jgi:ribA/ribD-fused uncharacterized protein